MWGGQGNNGLTRGCNRKNVGWGGHLRLRRSSYHDSLWRWRRWSSYHDRWCRWWRWWRWWGGRSSWFRWRGCRYRNDLWRGSRGRSSLRRRSRHWGRGWYWHRCLCMWRPSRHLLWLDGDISNISSTLGHGNLNSTSSNINFQSHSPLTIASRTISWPGPITPCTSRTNNSSTTTSRDRWPSR